MKSTVFGILNVNKPSGITSRDVVNHVQRLIKPIKVGHAGTLDPLAEGVLIVTIGPATRLTQYIQRMPKAYRATFLLGKTSDTEDVQGNVTDVWPANKPSRAELEAAIPSFVGDISQRPPAYSALKLRGKRAYHRAREGERVDLDPRRIHVDQITVESYQHPSLTLGIRCGSGTYVRSLGRDLAESVGTAAVMSALTRTEIGHFQLTSAVSLAEITCESLPNRLIPPVEAVRQLPQVRLAVADQHRLAHGRPVRCPGFETSELAATNRDGLLLAILRRRDPELYGPAQNFAARQDES